MSWLIDNANTFYILLGIAGVGLFFLWRFNSRVKYLAWAVGMLAAMTFLWILSVNYKTDRKLLEDAVNDMARGVEAKEFDKVFKHISNDFRYATFTRETLYNAAQRHIKNHEVKNIRINRFNAEISRGTKFAKTGFIVSATAEREIVFRTEADFVLEGDKWMLKNLRFYRIGNDQEFDMIGEP